MTYEQYKESGGRLPKKIWEERYVRDEEDKARVKEELAALLSPRVGGGDA